MKTILMLLAVCFVALAHAQAQQRNWDARLSLNTGAYPYLQAGGDFFLNILNDTYVQNAYNAALLYQTKNRKIKIGLTATHIKVLQYYSSIFDWSGGSDDKHLLESRTVTAFMPAFNYSYLAKKNTQLYSELCFGAAFTKHQFYDKNVTEHVIDPAFQCTVLGCRVGNRIGGFAELGYGYKGIVQLGVSGTF